MPENTPMKMQWINIDGRSTPIVLPQIWDHEKQDWIVTGTENPLPTQVTGSNVELISRVSESINSRFFAAGETTGSGHIDYRLLDISDYRQVSVLIQNKTSENIDYLELHYSNEASGQSPLKERLRLHHDGADITLDAGDYIYIHHLNEYLDDNQAKKMLKDSMYMYFGFFTRFNQSVDDEEIVVSFYGKK